VREGNKGVDLRGATRGKGTQPPAIANFQVPPGIKKERMTMIRSPQENFLSTPIKYLGNALFDTKIRPFLDTN